MFFYTLTLFFFVFQIPLNKFRDIDWLYDFFFLTVEQPSSFSRSLKKNGVKGSGGIALSSKILGRTKFRSLEIFERSEKNIPRVLVNGIKEGFISLIYLSPVHRLVVPWRILAPFQSLAAGIGRADPTREGPFHLFPSVWYPAARAGASSRLALDLWQGDRGGADRETTGGGGRGAFHATASTR